MSAAVPKVAVAADAKTAALEEKRLVSKGASFGLVVGVTAVAITSGADCQGTPEQLKKEEIEKYLIDGDHSRKQSARPWLRK